MLPLSRAKSRAPRKPRATPQRLREAEAAIARLQGELVEARAAADAAQQFHGIVDDSLQGIVVHRDHPLYVNMALVRMLGLPSRQAFLASASVLDHIHPDDRDLVRSQMGKRLSGQEAIAHYEFRMCRADGSELWVHCTGQMIAWSGGTAAIASLYDITARKRAEAGLRRSEQLFVKVFQASPDVLSLTTLEDGRYVDVNQSFLKLAGRKREELIGRTSAEVGFWGDSAFRAELIDKVRRDGVVRNAETKIRTATGELRDFAFSVEAIRFEDRDLLLAVGRDMTERRREAAELRESKEAAELANRSKSEFLANMSHELRTPLNAILGFSEVIRDQLFGPVGTPRYGDYARHIHESGEHLLQIINDLLDLSKLEAGKVELHERQLAVPRLIEDCLRLVQGRADTAGVRLSTDLPAGLPELQADERLLKQILINLLSNAVKFTPAGGRVGIGGGRRRDGALELKVADTGIGMTASDIEVALTPFGQVDGSFSRRQQGTGLGLPLAKSLAELHGGTLEVWSTPGIGTTVTVTLPAGRVVAARAA